MGPGLRRDDGGGCGSGFRQDNWGSRLRSAAAEYGAV